MLKHHILFFDDERANRKTASRVLCSTGAHCQFPETIEALEEALPQYNWSLIIMDVEAHRFLTDKGIDLQDQNIVILSSEKLKITLPYLSNINTFTNFIAKNDTQILGAELLATTKKILHNDIFGVQKYLTWGASNMVFHVRDSSKRHEYSQIALDYTENLNVRRPIIQAVQSLCEEFLMNAFFDAPRDEDGNEIYSTLPRTERIILDPLQSARFEIASDGQILAISVSDPFGAITRKTVLEYLNRCFSQETSQKLGPEEKGGAGLGLYMCFNSVTNFIVNVDPHIRTEFIGIIDLNISVKEFKTQNKSFHFFSKDSHAKQFAKLKK